MAAQLGVSRQSVSKWRADPQSRIDKILKLSALFGVSTDFLLKDSAELPPAAEFEETPDEAESGSVRVFTLAQANEYLALVRRSAGMIALGCRSAFSPPPP